MPYCSQCGVELDEYVEACPLCSAPVVASKKLKAGKNTGFPDKAVPEKDKGVLRFLAWEIVGVSLLTAFLIIALTNLITALGITWARYPLASIVLIWLLATFPLLLPKKPLLISILSVCAIMLFLALIDLMDNGVIDWYYYIALPITIMSIIVTTGVVMLCIKVKRKGANIAAFILFGIGIMAVGLDLILHFALTGMMGLTWSLYVIIPILFIGIFLLYIHYRLVKAVDLKKWFQV
jgi:hypothetical protein